MSLEEYLQAEIQKHIERGSKLIGVRRLAKKALRHFGINYEKDLGRLRATYKLVNDLLIELGGEHKYSAYYADTGNAAISSKIYKLESE